MCVMNTGDRCTMISLISTLKSILQEIRISCLHLETFIEVCFTQKVKDVYYPSYFQFFSYWNEDGNADVGKRCFSEMCSLSSSTKTPRCPGEHHENIIFSTVVLLLKNMAAPQYGMVACFNTHVMICLINLLMLPRIVNKISNP